MRIVAPMMITETAAKARPSTMPAMLGDVAQPIELRDPLLAVADVVDEGVRLHARRDALHRGRIARRRA